MSVTRLSKGGCREDGQQSPTSGQDMGTTLKVKQLERSEVVAVIPLDALVDTVTNTHTEGVVRDRHVGVFVKLYDLHTRVVVRPVVQRSLFLCGH